MDNSCRLDFHCSLILDEYRRNLAVFEKMKKIIIETIDSALEDNHLIVAATEARVKTEESLMGKLEIKGHKYNALENITDIVGARIITFYSDEVDKISALVQSLFIVDWENSVDKRRQHSIESFGYMSLHYICRIPNSLHNDPDMPGINVFPFEVQMRTSLQHVWANMYHDTGYKSGIEVPAEYLRNLNRLAGMLELADDEFSRIRTRINMYRKKVQALVKDNNFDEVPFNGDTFRSYLLLNPFDTLVHRIAAINQTEIQEANMMMFFEPLVKLGFKTLGDIEKMKLNYSDIAYKLAVHQIGMTDIDIISSTIALQNLCIAYIIENDGGQKGLEYFFEALNGPSDYNRQQAERLMDLVRRIKLKHIK